MSASKRRLFAAVCLLAPLAVVAVVEGALRQFGLGGYPPVLREVESSADGTLMISDPKGTRGFFFANPDRPGYVSQYAFRMPKPENTVRIVLAGGSAIQGFPHSRCFCAGAFLREMLADCWPGRTVEVVNLGTTAVASFPVLKMVEEALACDPDLVVVYSGHNEFYGAYGVASLNRAAAGPRRLALQYRIRGLALVQGCSRLVQRIRPLPADPLMKIMVGQDYVAPHDHKRQAAANLLYHHVGSMIRMSTERDVPILVCSLPSNERDLAPIGEVPDSADPDRLPQAADPLTSLLDRRPDDARVHYRLGQSLFAAGAYDHAREQFIQARDLDPMPWRATTESQQGIHRAVNDFGGQWCDVEARFRRDSPGGAIGWELMDDHLHPSLQGQALLARALVEALADRTDALQVAHERLDLLPDWTAYAERLGINEFDRYAVAHTMRVLFRISFMRKSNPEAFQRFDRIVREQESRMAPEILAVARQWQTNTPHAGGKRPLTGMVGRELLRTGQFEQAVTLFAVAQRSVPIYTSWHLEYVYFRLACQEQMHGALDPPGLDLAAQEITRGNLLLRHGYSESGLTERYLGRLHQLRGEYAEAIPYLAAARTKLYGFDKVATDQALVLSYVHTGDLQRARELARYGVQYSGQYANLYGQLLDSIPEDSHAQPPSAPSSTHSTGTLHL